MRRTTKVISLVEERIRARSTSSFLKVYFPMFHIITCCNFGFSAGKLLVLLRILQILVYLLRVAMAEVCIVGLRDNRLSDAIWAILTTTESLFIAAVFTLCKSKLNVRQLFEFLYSVDEELGKTVGRSIDVQLALSTVVVTVIRLSIYFCCIYAYYIYQISAGFVVEFIYQMPCYCTELYFVVQYIVYLTVYCRLKALRLCLYKRFDVYKCTVLYKSLIDNLEEVKNVLDGPVVVSILNAMGTSMTNVLVVLELVKEKKFNFITSLPRCIETILRFFLAFAPMFVADMMSSEARKIKNILINKLQTDHSLTECSRREIHQFVDYVSCRPFRLRVCRVMSLHCTLPITVLSVCVTYTIVLVQFKHLY